MSSAFRRAAIRGFGLPLFTALLGLAAVPAAADEYLVFLSGYPDMEEVSEGSTSVVALLQEHHDRAFSRVEAGIRGLGFGETTTTHLWIANAFHLECDRVTAGRISRLAGVERVQPVERVPRPRVTVPDRTAPQASKITWSVEKVKAPAAWAAGIDGRGVVVGHIDTGVDPNHPDLKGKILRFRDFVDTANTSPKDGDGHGTHTAGTIAGGAAGGTAIGVAPGARLIVARVLDENGSNTFRLLRAMQWMMDPDDNNATNDAPQVCSNSWGSTLGFDPSFWLTVSSWRKAGIVPVFAAGNEGPDPKTTGIPGGYPHSYAVGATDDRDRIADFSSRGPVRWGLSTYVKPDVSAPGDFVYSANDGGGYTYLSGTSMATPAVAGALALLKQKHRNWTVDQLEARLAATSVDLGAAGKDNDFGAGRIDVARALGLAE